MSQTREKPFTLCRLFLAMMSISAVTFGGGFVIVSFMKKKFVDEFRWLEEEEMLDMTVIAQSAPGPIAVNAAIQLGWKMGGLPAMLTAVLATILPPMVILGLLTLCYNAVAANPYAAAVLKGMQAAVAAVILDVSLNTGIKQLKSDRVFSAVLIACALIATLFLKVNVILILVIGAGAGVLRSLITGRKGRDAS